MKIQDLSKDLSHEERAVRGGAGNALLIGGQNASNSSGGGIAFGPETNVQIGPTVTQTYAPVSVDLNTITLTKTLESVGSAFQNSAFQN
jgi:hypothetical protein